MGPFYNILKKINRFIFIFLFSLSLGACSSISIHWMRFDNIQGTYYDGTQKVIKANKDIDEKEITSKPIKILTDNMGLVVKFHY